MEKWLYPLNQLLRLETALAATLYAMGGVQTALHVVGWCIVATASGVLYTAEKTAKEDVK